MLSVCLRLFQLRRNSTLALKLSACSSHREKVAIKKIQNVFENVADATRILREIKLLRLLKQPDVVEVKHVLLPSDPRNFQDIYVVFELMESDLHTVIGANDDLTPDHHKVCVAQPTHSSKVQVRLPDLAPNQKVDERRLYAAAGGC